MSEAARVEPGRSELGRTTRSSRAGSGLSSRSATTRSPSPSCGRARSTSSTRDKHAIQKVNLDIGRNEVIALIGPSGCGKSTFIRCLNRMNDTIESGARHGRDHARRRGHLRQAHGRRDAARARRHGVPEAESVSEVRVRQRRVRSAHSRARARSRAARRDRADEPRARGALGKRSRIGSRSRAPVCRAASSSGCASPARSP